MDDQTIDVTKTPFTCQNGGGFVIIAGPNAGSFIALRGEPLTFGSAPECDVVLKDKSVSRRHLTARQDGSFVVLCDEGSRNGSYVQGTRFKDITVGYGAEIRLGRTVLKYLPRVEAFEPDDSDISSFGSLIGRSAQMRQLFALLHRVAQRDTTVLIEGETGTGKELVAQEIHNHSSRSGAPFVVFDCGAVPRELVASELFGHVRGSFTGAHAARKGAFVEATGGTLFLDEIGELPLDLQPALLRALDKKAVRPIGADIYKEIDVRIVAATNRDLAAAVKQKEFREDLYYRLAVMHIRLPPLRERGDDIELLAQQFSTRIVGSDVALGDGDVALLRRASWPGNVRELRNIVERAWALSAGSTPNFGVALSSLTPITAVEPPRSSELPFKEARNQIVGSFEREYLLDLLRRHENNLSAAAREAQIDRKTLRDLIRRHGRTR